MPLRTILKPVYPNTRWTLLLYNLLAPKVQVSFRDLVSYPDLASFGIEWVLENVEVAVGCLPITAKLLVLIAQPRPQTPDINRGLQKAWGVRVWAYKLEIISFEYFLDLF